MLERRFIIVAGKGGVGRTTVAAALAVLLARRGKRVLLAHVRTKQRMAQLLGSDEIDEHIREVGPNLWAVNMNPEAALREKGLMVLRFKTVYRAVMENRIVRYFLRAVPALNEYSMLGKAWHHTVEMEHGTPKYDTVVFDGPAMGHLLTMLRIPQVITETVPEGPLTSDARQVLGLLRDPARTAMWIVTLAEDMPVREAVEIYHKTTRDLGIAVERVVVNALYPDDFSREPRLAECLARLGRHASSGVVDSERADPDLSTLLASAETLRARREINERYLHLIDQQLPLPRIELPYLFVAELNRQAIDALADEMERTLPVD
jgi:anion-transporting  ArsA/GET3 family ATPase